MKTIFVALLAILFCFINNCESSKDISHGSVLAPVGEASPTPPNNSNKTLSEPPPMPPEEPKKKPLEYENSQDKALFEAVEQNNVARVKEILEQGANANAKVKIFSCAEGEPAFSTVLGESVEMKNSQIAKLLLQHGADVNAYFSCGNRVYLNFQRAVVNQDIAMMKLLVGFGAETGRKDDEIQILINAKSKEVLDYLIEIGFDINSRDRIHGFTPLFLAVRDNNLDLVRAILQHKPNLAITTEPTKINGNKELTVLQLAESIGNKEIIQELKRAGINR